MIWILLISYQVKHLLADYFFQTPYMLGKFKKYPDFILPLTAHAAVHVLGTVLIAVFFVSPSMALGLGLLDGAIHFVVDYLKANPSMGGRFNALSKRDMYKIIANIDPEDGETLLIQNKTEYLKSNRYFWFALGIDQMAHHLTHYLIIALIIGAK